MSPDASTLPATPNVRVNPTGLTVGPYSGQVIFTSLAAGAPGTANVPLIVTAPEPALKLSGNSLSFTGPPAPLSQTLLLSTTGGSIQFSAAATPATWLSVTPTNAVVLPGAPVTLTVLVYPYLAGSARRGLCRRGLYRQDYVDSHRQYGSDEDSKYYDLVYGELRAADHHQCLAQHVADRCGSQNCYDTRHQFRACHNSENPRRSDAAHNDLLQPDDVECGHSASQLASAATLDILTNNPNPGGASAATVPFTVSAVPTVDATVSAASYAGPSVAPGELITLFGAAIGPATPAFLTDADVNGYVDTTLGRVDVTLDGIAAPMIYVSQNQITVQVPNEVSAGAGKAIVVTSGRDHFDRNRGHCDDGARRFHA